MSKVGKSVSIVTHYKRYAIGNVLVMAAGFVSFPITSRLLSATEFGVMGYWDAWILLLTAALKLGAGDAMLRFFPHQGDDAAHKRYVANFVLLPSIIGVGGWVLALLAALVSIYMGWIEHPAVALLSLCLVLNQVFISHGMWSLTTREHSGIGASINVIWRWLMVGVTLSILMFGFRSAEAVFVGRAIVTLLVAGWLIRWMFRNMKTSADAMDWQEAKEGLKYGLPLSLKEISSVVMSFIDRIMLKTLLGDFALVGVYSIGFALASYVDQVISNALGQAWTPAANRIYQTEGAAGVRQAKQRILRPLVYVCVGLATGVFLAGHSFVALLSGADKAAATGPVFVTAAMCLLVLPVLTIANTGLLLERRSHTVFQLTLVSAVCNVLMNLYMIPKFGVMGATVTNCTCQIGLQLATFGFCPRDLRSLPPVSVVARALGAAFLCVMLERWIEPPFFGAFMHCLMTLGFLLAAYTIPVVLTDASMRSMVLRRRTA
jgi:O-antigen/teichoic acid export membrane protein